MSVSGPDSLAWWVHDLEPEIVRFGETLAIRWYGVSYLLGFVAVALLLRLYHARERSPLGREEQASALTAIILGVVLGGRLGYMVLYDLADFLRNPLLLIKVWEGGMASHGGFVGCALACAWIARTHGLPFLRVSDICVTLAPPGLFFGRVANFINGELWGKASEVGWAVIFPASAPPGTPTELIVPRHPSQLYEAGLEGIALGFYIQWRFWQGQPKDRPDGYLAGEFLVAYAILRILGEQFREPDAGLIIGMSRGIVYSLCLILAGLGLIWLSGWLARRRRTVAQSPPKS